jgi:flagellar basal body-associated protein FliL
MTTKKIIVVVLSVVIVLGVIVLVFAGGIVGFVFYQIGNSDAAEVSRNFLKTNEKLKQDIGEVKEFGKFVTGNVNISSGDGTATLNLKVIGERKTVNASVELIYRNNKPWRVVQASYQNEAGQTINLLDPYQSRNLIPRMAA